MTSSQSLTRLEFLARVANREARHLELTDGRLFASPFTAERAASLESDIDLAERVEAFIGRFGRLQDTLGDKLLPALLAALGEPVGAQLDNLDRAERLGLIVSAETWFAARQLRNQMVHEYIEDKSMLASALNAGHDFVGKLVDVERRIGEELRKRGWIAESK